MEEIRSAKEFFTPDDTLGCGQIFRYKKEGNGFSVISVDKACYITEEQGETVIKCEKSDKNYFYNFFDLQTDYKMIYNRAVDSGENALKNAAEVGKGVRILRQNAFEMIISFIISQNNNISRIKGIIEKLCERLGEKKIFMGKEYYSFPNRERLLEQNEDFFKETGLGYRANYLPTAIKEFDEKKIELLKSLNTKDLKNELLSVKGIGEKVANCIILFGFYRTDSFPTDVWIDKIYRENMGGTLTDRRKITEYFVKKFGSDGGYFQQYLFHYKRNKENGGK